MDDKLQRAFVRVVLRKISKDEYKGLWTHVERSIEPEADCFISKMNFSIASPVPGVLGAMAAYLLCKTGEL